MFSFPGSLYGMKCKNTEKHPYWWRKPEYVTPKYVSLTYWFELNSTKKEQKQKKFSLPSSFLSKALLFCCQLCPTLCDPMDCSPPGSSVHGIFQARILEWAAISYSRGSSWPKDQTCICCISCIAGRFFITLPPGKPLSVWRQKINFLCWSEL